MTVKEFKVKVKSLKKIKEELSTNLKSLMRNEEISIDERFDALIESGVGGESWRTEFDMDRDDEFLYEGPCYMSKYESRCVGSILGSLVEDKDFAISDEEIQAFKSYCVNGCYSTMTFDW